MPRKGSLEIITKSKLAKYAADLRKQWEEEKAKLVSRWHSKQKKQP